MEALMSLLKLVHVPPASVPPTGTALEAIQTMAEEGVGAVAVVEDGVLRGVFTERDVMLRVVLRRRNANEVKVGEVMTSPVETISDESSAEDALNFMIERHIRHLPILGADGKLKGVLSIRNLLEHMVEGLRHELHSLDQYLLNDGPGG